MSGHRNLAVTNESKSKSPNLGAFPSASQSRVPWCTLQSVALRGPSIGPRGRPVCAGGGLHPFARLISNGHSRSGDFDFHFVAVVVCRAARSHQRRDRSSRGMLTFGRAGSPSRPSFPSPLSHCVLRSVIPTLSQYATNRQLDVESVPCPSCLAFCWLEACRSFCLMLPRNYTRPRDRCDLSIP